MDIRKKTLRFLGMAGALYLAFPGVLHADTTTELEDLKRRIHELELKQQRQNEILEDKTTTIADELEKSKLSSIIPEKAALKSEWGLGPAASSVYHVKQGLSIGAYGEGIYENFIDNSDGAKNTADAQRFVTYIGYKFNDWILFNSEVELEHATTEAVGGDSGDEEGEVSLEFGYLDFLFDRSVNARVGSVLMPMGFLNELHEPTVFHGVLRPQVERVIIPSTWNENGAGLFGEFDAAGRWEYRTYLVNGLRASRFETEGIREGRQGSNRALFEDIAWTARLDYNPNPIPGMMVGGSFYFGNAGQNETFAGQQPNVFTAIGEAHAQYRYRQLELRALGSWTSVDDAELLSKQAGETIANNMYGWYTEAAYNVLPHFSETQQYLAPFVRFEQLDTQADVPSGFEADPSQDKTIYTIGLTYRPISQVVLKADYRNIDNSGPNKQGDEVALGIGFAF